MLKKSVSICFVIILRYDLHKKTIPRAYHASDKELFYSPTVSSSFIFYTVMYMLIQIKACMNSRYDFAATSQHETEENVTHRIHSVSVNVFLKIDVEFMTK